jgi:hypothetical protein
VIHQNAAPQHVLPQAIYHDFRFHQSKARVTPLAQDRFQTFSLLVRYFSQLQITVAGLFPTHCVSPSYPTLVGPVTECRE